MVRPLSTLRCPVGRVSWVSFIGGSQPRKGGDMVCALDPRGGTAELRPIRSELFLWAREGTPPVIHNIGKEQLASR